MKIPLWFIASALACLPTISAGQDVSEANPTSAESPTTDPVVRGKELTIRSLAYDAERRPYLGHFMQDAVTGWNKLPKNILRAQRQQELTMELAEILKGGLSAQHKVSGITGAPELNARVGVGFTLGPSFSIGTSMPIPIYGAGYRDAVVRHAAARNPLMKTVRDPEAVARQFFDLVTNDPEAAKLIAPLAETLFTVKPLNFDPNLVLEKDERVRFEERERAHAQEIRSVREEISRLSRERASDAGNPEVQQKLSQAVQRHKQLSEDMGAKFRAEFQEHLNALIDSVDSHRSATSRPASSALNQGGLEAFDAAERERLSRIAKTYESLENWTMGVATIAGIVDPQTGSTIGTAGELMLNAVSLYYAPSFSSLSSFVGLYSSLVGQLLGGSTDIAAERHEQVMAALRGLDQKLTQMRLDLDSGFATVHEQIAGLNRQVFSVQDAVNDLTLIQRSSALNTASTLGRVENSIVSIDLKLDRRARQEWIEKREASNQTVSVNIYEGSRLEALRSPAERTSIASAALASYIIHADHGSTQAVHLGHVLPAPLVYSTGEIDPGASFSLIGEGLSERGAVNSYNLLASSLGISPKRPIRNPEEYLRGAVASLLIPADWPADYPRLSTEQRNILSEAGKDVISLQGEFVREPRLAGLLKAHEAAFQRFLGATRKWVSSEATQSLLRLRNPIDILKGTEQFDTSGQSKAFSEQVEAMEIPLNIEHLATHAPQMVYTPRQIYWEHQNTVTPFQDEPTERNGASSWARRLGMDSNSTIRLDPRLLNVNRFVSSVLRTRGEVSETGKPLSFANATVQSRVDLRPSAYNQFEGAPIFRNTIVVSVSPICQFTVSAGEPAFPVLSITASSDKRINVYSKVYPREFRAGPTGPAATTEEMAELAQNGNFPAEVKQYLRGDLSDDLETGLKFLLTQADKIRAAGGLSLLEELGTIQLSAAGVVYQKGVVSGIPGRIEGERKRSFFGILKLRPQVTPIPVTSLEDPVPSFKTPGFMLTLSGSPSSAQQNAVMEAQRAFLHEKQKRALALFVKEATLPKTEISNTLADLEAVRRVVNDVLMQGCPTLVMREAAVYEAFFGQEALMGVSDVIETAEMGILEGRSIQESISSFESQNTERSGRAANAVRRVTEVINTEGDSVVGSPAIREVLADLTRVNAAK